MLHFEISEFSSPDEIGSGSNMDSAFLQMLDDARGIAGIPFRITSGFRTPSHNAYVGVCKEVHICMDMQPILPVTIQQTERSYLTHLSEQDLEELESPKPLSIATMTLIKTQPFGYTRTVGNTLNE